MLSKLIRISIWFAILSHSLVFSQSKKQSHIHIIDSLMDVAYELEFSNPDSAIYLYNEIARLAETVSDEIAVHTYRIIQELVSNTLKHAEASEMHIQLIINDGKLSIAVEDNGKGFEIRMAGKYPANSGIGLSNVENRITFLQGNFDIHSSTDTGTSINIEIPLKKKAS